jgi:cysteine-rich repeat protein
VPAGCGNGVLGDAEECDDGNDVDGDGCDVDCTFSCETDEDCQNETVCDGIETCDVSTRACQAGAPPDCSDSENTMNEFGEWGPECTVDTCDPAVGCVNTLRDRDGDGYPPASYMVDGASFSCAGTANNDCNDIDETVFPGAEEICDGRDNNCQGGADETAPTWFADCDGDGFAALGASTFTGCTPPSETGCPSAASADWTTLRPVNGNRATYDCNDANDDVYPGQTMFRTAIPAPGSGYDWNCDGTWEQESPDPTPCTGMFCPFVPVCLDLGGRCAGTGRWDDRSAPACGRSEDYAYCETLRGRGCGLVPRARTQRCR